MLYVETNSNNILEPRIGDAGYDLIAESDPIFNFKSKYIEYDTGVKIAPSDNEIHSLVLPRSSISNYWLSLANSVPLIDSSYRGSIKLRFRYLGNMEADFLSDEKEIFAPLTEGRKIYKKGDKIGQLLFFKSINPLIVKVDNFKEDTERKTGAFGSTGK
jgi:dUTPase